MNRALEQLVRVHRLDALARPVLRPRLALDGEDVERGRAADRFSMADDQRILVGAPRRALGDDLPVHLKLVVEGSEEQGTGGLEAFVPEHADLLRADAILVADTGNAAVGHPAVTSSLRAASSWVSAASCFRPLGVSR